MDEFFLGTEGVEGSNPSLGSGALPICKSATIVSMRQCKFCEGSLGKHAKIYCSIKCQQGFQRKVKVDSFLAGGNPQGWELPVPVRDYLLDQAGYACVQCSWSGINPASGRTVLVVDHIDGDATNNIPTNLRVLCPNCHSMTPTFGALNIGHGRAWRYKRSTGSELPV